MKDIGRSIRDGDLETRVQHHNAADATTMEDMLAALRRQYIPLVFCTLFALAAGIAHHVSTPKQYYASATILVDERRSDLDEEITASIPFLRSDTSLLNEIQVLKSLQLAKEVAGQLELQTNETFLYPPSSAARKFVFEIKARLRPLFESKVVNEITLPSDADTSLLLVVSSKLQGDINIERIGPSFSIDISYIGHDADLAAQIVNTYAEAYLEDRLKANVEATERTTLWMRKRLDELEQSSADVFAEAAALRRSDSSKAAQLRELVQRGATLDALHQTISARFEQTSIQGSFPVSNGRILTRSIVPKTAALPKLWQTLVLATLMGMMLGLMLAVWREARERSFRISKDVHDYTGRAFLGHLPLLKLKEFNGIPAQTTKEIILNAKTDAHATRSEPKISDGVSTPTELPRPKISDLPPHLFWSVSMPQSMYSDTLRNIHTAVDLGAMEGSCLIVAVTSMLSGEGKTTLAVNYANMLAKSGARVLLIDMGLGGQSFSDALDVPPGPGIFEVLRGEAPLPDAMQVLEYTGLNIIPSGPTQQQSVAGDVLYQHNMQALMQELRKHYDYVVLDMPPLGKVSDAKAMIAQLDKIILVCEWGKTPRSLVAQYLAHEPEISQKVVGITLNKVHIRKLQKYARPGWPESYLETNLKTR